MTEDFVGQLAHRLTDPEYRQILLASMTDSTLVGVGLVVASQLTGISTGRVVIKLGFAVAGGLAVGRSLYGLTDFHHGKTQPNTVSVECLRENTEDDRAQAIATIRGLGSAGRVALAVWPYTLELVLLSMGVGDSVRDGTQCRVAFPYRLVSGSTNRP